MTMREVGGGSEGDCGALGTRGGQGATLTQKEGWLTKQP